MTKKPSCSFQSLKNRILLEWVLLKVRVYLRAYAVWIFLKALRKSNKSAHPPATTSKSRGRG